MAVALLCADGAAASTVSVRTETEGSEHHGALPRAVDQIAVTGDAAAETPTIAFGAPAVVVHGSAPVAAAAGCAAVDATSVSCALPSAVRRLAVDLGAGDDAVRVDGRPTSAVLAGGPGADRLDAGIRR